MSHSPLFSRFAPLAAAAALLAGTAFTAHASPGTRVGAHGSWGHGPVSAGGRVGVVQVRHGGYYGGYRGGYYRSGWGWGWGLGLGVGVVLASPWVVPGVVQVVPPVTVVETVPPPLPVSSGRPDPVIYPRNGQSAQQIEADRQECNRWATTQPSAMADAGVFQRSVEACMDARGYTLR